MTSAYSEDVDYIGASKQFINLKNLRTARKWSLNRALVNKLKTMKRIFSYPYHLFYTNTQAYKISQNVHEVIDLLGSDAQGFYDDTLKYLTELMFLSNIRVLLSSYGASSRTRLPKNSNESFYIIMHNLLDKWAHATMHQTNFTQRAFATSYRELPEIVQSYIAELFPSIVEHHPLAFSKSTVDSINAGYYEAALVLREIASNTQEFKDAWEQWINERSVVVPTTNYSLSNQLV